MKIIEGKEQEYQDFVEVNSSDEYSCSAVRYMQSWVAMMEADIASGIPVAETAEKTQFKANREGITGFLFGCVVEALSQFWVHGEELRKWHNGNYGHSGDGVVNPAVLTIG